LSQSPILQKTCEIKIEYARGLASQMPAQGAYPLELSLYGQAWRALPWNLHGQATGTALENAPQNGLLQSQVANFYLEVAQIPMPGYTLHLVPCYLLTY
jgi:hypothetical protein